MRDNVRAFVQTASAAWDLPGPVYEFGSFLVPGQGRRGDLRPLFPGREFVGCDLRGGAGVDRIEDLGQLKLADGTAQTIVCVDTLEHVFEARRGVEEMIRVLAPGGVILIAVPMDFRVHDYPSDYWRLTPSCVERLLAPLGAQLIGSQGREAFPHTVFGVGCKRPVSRRFAQGANRFMAEFQSWLDDAEDQRRRQEPLYRWATQWLRGKGQRARETSHNKARFVLQMQTTSREVSHVLQPHFNTAPATATRQRTL
jgi:SAM-dependent methyltransferase